jgi:serine/threonine protein kinase
MSYTSAVDYWSLGVTVYAMVYGKLPFRRVELSQFQNKFDKELNAHGADPFNVFTKIFGKVHYYSLTQFGCSSYNSQDSDDYDDYGFEEDRATEEIVEDFIENLLIFNPDARTRGVHGTGTNGSTGINYAGIKSHAFFKGIDWEAVQKKELKPPPIPIELQSIARQLYDVDAIMHPNNNIFNKNSIFGHGTTFEDSLIKSGRGDWFESTDHSNASGNKKLDVPLEYQKFFTDWYYVSPETIDAEIAIQTAKNLKKL